MASHRDAPDDTAASLERCATGNEIRYREAECLRELAKLDRTKAVALVRDEERRGWGLSSNLTRYAKTISRFPSRGQLEFELADRGLVPSEATSVLPTGEAAILASEILEANGVLHRFNPSCSHRYCEHAPLVYDLVAMASPSLDDLVIVERWPALDEVDLGSGPRSVSTSVRGIPVTFHVDEKPDGEINREQLASLTQAANTALAQPHELIIHTRRTAHRLALRNLELYYDLESIIGGLNTILAERGSELRFVSLAPHCSPCSQILVGPRDGIIGAALDGLIEVADPFNELWGLTDFRANTIAPEP
jgi:hypothetical protein